jgi:DMSO/TMAO reductase YedYZ molybdopterin-dependent catalytic subunit
MGSRERRRAGSAAALLGTAAGLAAAAVVTTLWSRFPFPVVAVAERVATVTPGGIATFFIELLQHLALPLTVVATAIGLAVVTWLLGRFLLPGLASSLGPTGASVVAAVPVWAIAVLAYEPDATTVSRPAFAAVLGACAAFGAGLSAATYRRILPGSAATAADVADVSRRAVLRAAWVGVAGIAVGWLQIGRFLVPRPNPGRLALPVTPASTVAPPTDAPGFDAIEGLAARVTTNNAFYVVDEEIVDPDVDAGSWNLSVGGSVASPFTLTYEELLTQPLVEQYATLECISNPVGGDLISTTRWTGVRLADLLHRASVSDGAVEVVFHAIGGYADSIPLTDAMRPVTLIIVGMNGMTLPREHGYPARVLAPGYYGMKQPKWLESIEVVQTPFQGYWERRGWIKAAIVRTMSRVDALDENGSPGYVVAGVAFAGDRGIERVEVSTDEGSTWADAELEPALSGLTWRRWRFPFDPAGAAAVLVRATDGDGAVQVSTPQDPHPSGATGYQRVSL